LLVEGRRLDACERELRAVGPHAVLSRGYSYTTTPDGRLVRSAREVSAEDEIVTTLADGRIRSVVGVEGRRGEGDAKRRRRAKTPTDGASSESGTATEQMGLFGASKGE